MQEKKIFHGNWNRTTPIELGGLDIYRDLRSFTGFEGNGFEYMQWRRSCLEEGDYKKIW